MLDLKKTLHLITRALFWLLFTGMAFVTLMYIHEIFHVMNASPDELKQYPFGIELWNYCSKKTYLVSTIDAAYINLLSLALSFTLYRLGKQHLGYQLASIAVVLLPLLLGFALFEPL